MFAVLISGRLPQTDFVQINETQFVCNVENAENINHIVVFMTGQTYFPVDLGAAVYFSWPSIEGPIWQLLGHIYNDKPSIIFKVSNLKKGFEANFNSHPFGFIDNHQKTMIQIGLSIENLFQINQQTPISNATASTVESHIEFSKKMLEDCFNYISSYSVNAKDISNFNELYVPFSTLQSWYKKFERRLLDNPNFWK